jgi:hypothetical protein
VGGSFPKNVLSDSDIGAAISDCASDGVIAIPEARPREVFSQLRRLNELFMVERLEKVI